jgi:hypothetical protein
MPVSSSSSRCRRLVLVEKHNNGRVTMREILQVRFSQLEDTEPS